MTLSSPARPGEAAGGAQAAPARYRSKMRKQSRPDGVEQGQTLLQRKQLLEARIKVGVSRLGFA